MAYRLPRPLAGAALTIAGAALLAGCGSNPLEDAIGGAIEEAVENGVEDQVERGLEEAGVEIQVGDDVQVPDDFPAVPLPKADPTSAIGVDGGWQLTYTGITAEQFDALVADIAGSGAYEQTGEATVGELQSYQYRSDEYQVALTFVSSDSVGELSVMALPITE